MIPTSAAERAAYEQGRARGVAETLSLIEAVQAAVPSLLPPAGQRLTLSRLAQSIDRHGAENLAILRPFDPREAIALKEAAAVAGRAESTVREWIARYAIGRNVVGSTMVSLPALLALLDGDTFALAALLAGHRTHPAVRPYLDRAGMPIAA